jgi:hypothetical protein
MTPTILLAAGLDWLEGILPAVFVGFWILSQVFAVFRRAGRGGGPVVVVKPMPAPEAEPVLNRDRLQEEIEKFLLERRRGRPDREAETRAPAAQPVRRASPQRLEEPRPRPQRRQPVAPPPPAATAASAAIVSDVARHVEEAFAHDLAHEAPLAPGDVPATRPTAAGGLATLLRDPETIRRLIVMREVLERPTERWS